MNRIHVPLRSYSLRSVLHVLGMPDHREGVVDLAPHSRQCPTNLQQDVARVAHRYRSGRRILGLKDALFLSLLIVFSSACMIQCFKHTRSRLFGTDQPWSSEAHRHYGSTFHPQTRQSAPGAAFVNGLRPVWRAAKRASCRAPLFRLRDAATSFRLKDLRLPISLKTLQGSQGSQTETTAGEFIDDSDVPEAGGMGKSALWGNWTESQVKEATLLWIEQVVIGMKLCPFAMEAMGGLRVAVSEAEDFEMALDKFDVELKWLVGLDKEYACTMIVYPPALFDVAADADVNETIVGEDEQAEVELGEKDCSFSGACSNFEAFMSLAKQESDMAQCLNAARGQDIESETLLLTFHPNSQFGDVDDDPADFALRSPFPTLLILRGSDVREAEDVCEQQGRVTEDIAIANEARLRQVGYAELATALENIWAAAREGRATELIEAAQLEREQALEAARQAAEAEAGEQQGYDGWDGVDGGDELRVKPLEIQDGNLDFAGRDGRLSLRAEAEGEGEAQVVEAELVVEGAEEEEEEETGDAAGALGDDALLEVVDPYAKEMIEPFDPFGYAADELGEGPIMDEDEYLGGGGDNKGDRI